MSSLRDSKKILQLFFYRYIVPTGQNNLFLDFYVYDFLPIYCPVGQYSEANISSSIIPFYYKMLQIIANLINSMIDSKKKIHLAKTLKTIQNQSRRD